MIKKYTNLIIRLENFEECSIITASVVVGASQQGDEVMDKFDLLA